MNFHDLDNYNLADAVKFHQRLNPRLWGKDEHLLPEVRDKLLAIASDFQEFLGVDELNIQDITISGSNAAYSYTPHSDIDLHLVVDIPDDPVYQELFAAKKYQYNAEHDIKIAGVPVELYVQPSDQKHVSQGIYSVKNGDWTQVPQRRRASVDDSCVQHKTADLDARIHSAIKSGDANSVNQLWDKIKTMRQTGLEQNGEFGCENIAFKLLRNSGCLGKLKKAKTAIQDRELSLARKPTPRKKVNYGMRDYWYPGTAYAGQDHPAGTESEHLDESAPDQRVIELQKELKAQGAYLGTTGPAKDGVDGIMGPLTRAAQKQFSSNGSDVTLVSTNTPATTKITANPRAVVVGDSIALGIAQATKLPYDAVVGRSTRAILSAAASNPDVQGADVAIVSAGTNDYPLLNGGRNTNPDATINNISRIRDVLKAKQYVWILPFNRSAARDVMSAIGGDAYVDLADISTTKDNLHPTSYNVVAKAALSKSLKEDITEDMDPNHLKKILHRFYASCVDKLQLKNPPRLRLETTPAWSQENGSFGQYEPETNTLILATSGRHVLDILRTMAHEMTHRQQDEQNPLPIEAGETGSPWEDQANAMAGRIMRDWAQEQPEMFDGVTLEEASGYIPTKAQAKDPRFVMALTKDVRPGAVGREANKLGLETDSQGHPALLTAGLNKLLREFKEQDLLEQSPGAEHGAEEPWDRDGYEPRGPEFPPQWPAGTTKIDVSDLTDWYRLGVDISDMDDAKPENYMKGPPQTIMVFATDELEQRYLKQFKRLGLKTHDMDTDVPGGEDKTGKHMHQALAEELAMFKSQDLFEINMGGKNLRREAAKTGALAGMEFEMIVPDTSSDGQELEPDFDSDESASSPSDIRDFFYDGDYNSRRSTEDMIDRIMDDYSNWQMEQFDSRWDGDAEEFIYQYIKENMDDDDVRQMLDLEEEDSIGRQEYLLAADMIVTEQMEPWYEDAQNDARDSFYEDDRFEDFLQDNDMDTMSGIYHRYDSMIHWPHYISGGGDTSVNDVADSFSAAVGRPAQARSDYHAYGQERPGPGKNFYVVEPDGSLEPDDHMDSGLEFVSPPLPIDDIMSDLKKVKAWADKTGCYTNDSTGLHINISVPNYSIDNLDYVKLALLMGDEYVLNNFGRAGNTYARSAMGKIKDRITPDRAKQILDTMKSGMDQLATKAIHSGMTDKYTSINTKDGHIEFRSPGGDWLDENFDKIENTLMRFTVAMSAALNPEAYRQEYLKKLYKMLSPKGENDPLAIFAKYAAGQLPKAALKSFVRQAQLERGNKAAKQAELDTMQKELAPASAEDNQGNWGLWLGSVNQFSRVPTAGQLGPLRRFPSQEAAEQFLAQTRASNPRMRADAEVREIQPAAPEAGSVQWNIVDNSGEVVHTFWNRNVQADADRATLEWVQAHWQDEGLSVRGPFATVPAAMQPGQQRWHITDDNDQVVYRFTASTAQRDANDVARNWIQSQPPSMSARGPFNVVPDASSEPIPGSTLDLQRQRQRDAALAAASMAADAAPSARQLQQMAMSNVTNPPYYPPPTPIPGVQDIDIDIPMAQTQWEVYNRSSNQPIFVMQAANQAEAWRIGQQWTAVALRDGTITDASHFSVRPSAQPVAESREITKLSKLDSVLKKCINMIHRGKETDPEKYGGVAACLIDNKNNHTYAINLPGPNGTRRHAERVAIDTHLKRHGRIGPNAIMVTTLSPCVNHMNERDGESCTELLSDYGIEKCYAGWQDPTQQPETAYPFNLQVTDNADIFNTCQDIAASFLPQVVANELNETINPDVFNPAFNDTQIFDGLTYRATGIEINGKEYFQVKVLDDNYKQIGLAKFRPSKNGLVSAVTSLKPEYQGRGIARNIYAYVRMLGNTIVPSRNQLPPGKAMWDAWKKSGDAKHLMRESASEREIAQVQYMQGECAVLALTIHKIDPQRFPLGFVYEFFDAMPDVYIEPDEFDELDPAQQQDIQYNHDNWTLTHAYVYDVKTKEYIDAEGRHKQLPTIGRDFNATRHNKFPAEVQDLVRVSHYMEWDEAQEKWIVLSGWDALDKAYTPEGQQRAREYAIKYLGIDRPEQDVEEDLGPDASIEIRSEPTSTGGVQVYAYRDGKEVGWVRFQKAGNGKVKATMVHVPERLRRQGIGSAMYKHARHELGLDIVPSDSQTADGRLFWNKIHEVEEEPIRIKLGNNNAAKAWIERVYAKYPHTMQNNHVMVWGSGDDQQFAMFELIPSFSKRSAVEVKWIQAYPLRQGVGSRAMKELQAMAKEDGISLTLFPWDKGQVSQSKLTKFYRGHGFKPTIKGGKAMQWEPK